MDFFKENLREVLEAINKLIDNNINQVNTKRIRRCNNVKASDRSKINFIWRSLNCLERKGILEKNGISKPKMYRIKDIKKEKITEILMELKK